MCVSCEDEPLSLVERCVSKPRNLLHAPHRFTWTPYFRNPISASSDNAACNSLDFNRDSITSCKNSGLAVSTASTFFKSRSISSCPTEYCLIIITCYVRCGRAGGKLFDHCPLEGT